MISIFDLFSYPLSLLFSIPAVLYSSETLLEAQDPCGHSSSLGIGLSHSRPDYCDSPTILLRAVRLSC